MMPKVMHILGSGADGGAEKACEDITHALHEAGLEQIVVMREHKKRSEAFKAAGIKAEVLPFGGLFDFTTPYALKNLVFKYQPDIIQTWLSRAARKLLKFKRNKPVIVSRLGGYYALKNYKKSDYFIANTPDIKKYLIREGVKEDKIVTIPNYADPGPQSPGVSKSDFETPQDATVFMTASRLHKDKGLDVFLKALARIPKAYGWIVGSGPERDALKGLAQKLQISGRVRFLGWRDDIEDILSCADIFVLASRNEPFGNAFLQAWACKKPVIASASQGPGQFITPGEDGILFPVDDVDLLAKAMQEVEQSKKIQDDLAERGFQRFSNEFSKEKCVKAYLDFYNRLYEAR